MKEKKVRLEVLKRHTLQDIEIQSARKAKELTDCRRKLLREGCVEGLEGGWQADEVYLFSKLKITTKGLSHIKELDGPPWHKRPLGIVTLAVVTTLATIFAAHYLSPKGKEPKIEQPLKDTDSK